MSSFGKGLYYGLQRFRGGVRPEMVQRAKDLLDRPWPEVRAYVEQRLQSNYGLGGRDGSRWLAGRGATTKADYREAGREVGRGASTTSTETERTSGSTGEPLEFRRDREMSAWMDAAQWAVYGWYGIEPGHRMARFWGRPVTGREAVRQRVADALLRQRRLSAFEVSAEESRSFFDELLGWNPRYAYGYPTVIREFVEHVREAGADGEELGLDVVITTGEMLDRATREALGTFFGCPVADEYGCSESGTLAFQCRAGRSHVIPVAAYTQVRGRGPGPDEVGTGPVLVTDLYGEVTPFVRYSLEDVARIHPPSECGCGRELPRLEVLAGRVDGFIRMPDGRRVHDAILAYSVPHGVAGFRVRQTAADRLEGEVVIAEGFTSGEVVRDCRASWREALGSELRIDLEAVDSVDRSDGGKRRYFVALEEERPASERDGRQDGREVGDSAHG